LKEHLPLIDSQKIALLGSLMLTCVLLAKLYAGGLTRTYRYFSCYLLYEVVCALLLMPLRQNTNTYGEIWILSKPMYWVLCLMVLLEVYSLVMALYPGIASMMRWTVIAAATASVGISILSLLVEFRNHNDPFPLLRCAFAVQRTVDTIMAISLLVPVLFILQFPVRLSRNSVTHCLLFSALVGIEAGGLFMRNCLGREFAGILNLAMSTGTILCLLGWIALLNRNGERTEQPVGPLCSPEMEQRLLDQLYAFNQVLLKTGQTQPL
jgi:hypothetical protein